MEAEQLNDHDSDDYCSSMENDRQVGKESESTDGGVPFENGLTKSGFGKYNVLLLSTCCMLIVAMYLDIFGFSVVLPAAACDLALSTDQRAMLSAVPLIGVMCMSYVWGLTADTLGRRTTLLYAMGAGFLLNMAASMAGSYVTLCVLKFMSAAFTASANAAGFVLVGEMTPKSHRNRFMFLMASATMFTQLIISLLALPILPLTFRLPVPLLDVEYRPWRLLLQVLSLPGGLGVLALVFFTESPKFLLSRGRHEDALEAMKTIYSVNTGHDRHTYEVTALFLEETKLKVSVPDSGVTLRRMWEQTAPLFKPPLLRHSLIVYYILLSAYMTSTGFTMWVPTLTNAYFDGASHEGHTFCEVASGAVSQSTNSAISTQDCDNVVQPMTLYVVMLYSGVCGTLNILLSFIVGALGRKNTTLLVFAVCTGCGILLNLARTPVLSIGLFYCFLYVCLVLAAINSYIVELYPTHLRGMATCLSVVVARGSGFLSINVIARAFADHCQPTLYAFILLVFSGGLVSLLLPGDSTKKKSSTEKLTA